ncbi:MAG: tRNA epoxyqueuosine(34) reductase QueG [Gammaproteobacteria bacterium]|nr:tRNA epoxyqueuosine(34) reductase QueG [Gammaproteobacteria bacterium]
MLNMNDHNLKDLAGQIRVWGRQLGFAHTAISNVDLSGCEARLAAWLRSRFHGEMGYMARHGTKRTRPGELVPGTLRAITVRMDYLHEHSASAEKVLEQPEKAYISRYALGRDYHKLIRKRLQALADRISGRVGKFGYRAFCDSAPVMEKALAEKSGQGWQGKHTNILNREAGSWFFLGELYTDLPLPVDPPVTAHCGRCQACMDICPTNAIVAPYQLDARRCISYLTIELKGPIPREYRKPMGNRIFGCDDCQLVCPWNKYAKWTDEADFRPRHQLDNRSLVELFQWEEETFLKKTEGSAIRRIGHIRWLRNIAIALGNARYKPGIVQALHARAGHASEIVRESVGWALAQQRAQSRRE